MATTTIAQAQTAKNETVSYKSGTETVNGYLALPAGGGKHPAIIVVHEWWGLNDWVKQQADRFAAQGYVALAVSLSVPVEAAEWIRRFSLICGQAPKPRP